MEALAKTISEICIANVGGNREEDTANYEVAGYELRDKKITEFAVEVKSFLRSGGALELLREVLSTEKVEFDTVELAPKLIQHTRLLAEGQNDE